jgi:uncharacterized protein (TIGR02466 family)
MEFLRIFSNFIAVHALELDLDSIEKRCFEKFTDGSSLINGDQAWVETEEMNSGVLAPLFKFVEKEFNNIHKKIGLSKSYHQELKNAWITKDNCYATSIPHTHPTAFFSAVFYVKTPAKCGNIEFMSPNAAQQQMYDLDMVEDYTEFSSTRFFLEPKANTLIIFPSYLIHYVNENKSDDHRISIAINSKLVNNNV